MKNVALYFGTFNPIHIGHLAIANYMLSFSTADEVWLVVTPHNPLKKKRTLLDDYQRLHMVNLAVEEMQGRIRSSNVEFNLPQPSYTSHTLAHLSEKHPDVRFQLIMGEDNLRNFHKWKNHEAILEQYGIIVYPRLANAQEETQLIQHNNIEVVQAPIIQISSTMIRNAIAEGKEMRYFLHSKVFQYLDEMNFYK